MRRGPKARGLVPADGDFIALGSSSRRQVQGENDGSSIPGPGGARKRPSGQSDDPIKRQRLEDPALGLFSNPLRLSSTATSAAAAAATTTASTTASPTPITVPAAELCERILCEESQGNWEIVDGLMFGLINQLKGGKGKLDPLLMLSVLALVKSKPNLIIRGRFLNEFVGLLSVRKETVVSKMKLMSQVPLLAANVLAYTLKDDRNWPESIVKAYIDDSLGERMWVDSEVCRDFVDNILTVFGTRLPSGLHQSSLLEPAVATVATAVSGASSLPTSTFSSVGGPEQGKEQIGQSLQQQQQETKLEGSSSVLDVTHDDSRLKVINRYCSPAVRQSVKNHTIQMVNEQLLNRIAGEPTTARKTIRFLCDLTGIPEVRVAVIQRLEACLQNPKLSKLGQDLLMSICENCRTGSTEDMETINHLVRIRVKSKPLAAHYVTCIKAMVQQHPANPPLTVKYVIYNELSQSSRNPNNMAVISMLFQTAPEAATKALASVFQELLTRKEDFVKALRGLFREVVRVLRYEMDFSAFCGALMDIQRDSPVRADLHGVKERYVVSVVDLVTVAGLLSVTPAIRDAAGAYSKGEKKDIDALKTFQKKMAEIQQESIFWLHTKVPAITRQLPKEDYARSVRKVLFIESLDAYYMKDGWPAENERNALYRLAGEVPLLEDTLMRVIILGSSPEIPLSPQEALEIADKVVRRAAMSHTKDFPMFTAIAQVDQLTDVVFRLCTYFYPEGIQLPLNYYAPVLAISKLYWKGWLTLLTLAAFCPETVGRLGWERYPTLRVMMEMVMTNNFIFPPFGQSDEERADELQLMRTERDGILQFEQYLAQATTKQTITEQNSHLVNQLITLEPCGPARRPPSQVIEQLKVASKRLMVGQWLCRSREPDFLLDIIQFQGTTKSMPWLVELVQSSSESLDLLPVQCLCEFLLIDMNAFDVDSKREAKGKREQNVDQQKQLRIRLQGILFGPEATLSSTEKIMEYFLPKTCASDRETRQSALRGLKLVLTESSDGEMSVCESFDWLVNSLPKFPHFRSVCENVCLAFRQACKIETDLAALTAYFAFLARHSLKTALVPLALDLARIVIKRAPLIGRMARAACRSEALRALLGVFAAVLTEAYKTKEKPNIEDWEVIVVEWPGEKRAYLHYSIIHGMIALLTHGPPDGDDEDFWKLMDAWFPEDGPMPAGYLLETHQTALILDRALKLCMIRSSVDRLVKAALDSSQLDEAVIFVQSFGIPVHSMSRLLQKLDEAVISDSLALEVAVSDNSDSPAYLSRLVDVEQMRGAKGGEKFKAYLSVDIGQAADEEGAIVQFDDVDCRPMDVDVDLRKSRVKEEVDWSKSLHRFLSKEGKRSEKLTILECVQKALLDDSSDQVMEKVAATWFNSLKKRSLSVSASNESLAARLLSLLKSHEGAREEKSASLDGVVSRLASLDIDSNSRLSRTISGLRRKPFVLVPENQRHAPSDHRKEVLLKASQILRLGASTDVGDGTDGLWTAGPVVDEVETAVGGEVNSTDADVHLDVVFGRGRLDCQSYLLSLVAHQSSWDTFHSAVDRLLTSNGLRRFKASAVLEYLDACLHSPRIWRGTTPLATGIESFNKDPESRVRLRVNALQGCLVVDYVLTDIEERIAKGRSQVEENVVTKWLPLIQACCCRTESEVLEAVVSHLQRHCNKKLADALLVQLYFVMPEIAKLFRDLPSISQLAVYANGASKMDPKIHRLLTALSTTEGGDDVLDDLKGQFLVVRSIAACHPGLVLRHLTLVAVLLKGQVHLNAKEFERRNCPLLFEWILELLEVLCPLLFQCLDCVCEPLKNILSTYFQFMRAYVTHEIRYRSIVTRFSEFLCRLHAANPTLATLHFLAEEDTVRKLAELCPDDPSIVSIAHFLSSRELGTAEGLHQCPTAEDTSSRSGKSVGDKWSEAELLSALESEDESQRDSAHCRIIAGLREGESSCAADFIPRVALCLKSLRIDVALSALRHLHEYVPFAGDQADMLIQCAFDLAMEKPEDGIQCLRSTFKAFSHRD